METNIIKSNLRHVIQRIKNSVTNSRTNPNSLAVDEPRLCAVSKTFPIDYVQACYDEGQRHFGENYAQELIQKSKELKDICPEIKWHYIGKLQSKQINKIASIPNLWCIETVASEKHASILNRCCITLKIRLNVFLQVNTSGEENKDNAPQLAEFIIQECPNLDLLGLMTIGSIAESNNSEANSDFQRLREARVNVAKKLNRQESELELSMGMSQDFELAINYGSTNLRIGSTIFGTRGICPIHNCPHH